MNRIKQVLKRLGNLKANGNKVGSLKFKSKLNSIPLKQYGITYKYSKNKKRDTKQDNSISKEIFQSYLSKQ